MTDRVDDEEPILKTLRRTCFSWIPAMLATTALLCGMLFGFWCESFQFKVDEEALSAAGNNSSDFENLHFGPWGQLKVSVQTTEVGGGYQRVYTTNECVDWQYEDPDKDAKWKATKAFSIITAIIGGFLVVGLWFVPCSAGRISADTWNGCAMLSAVFLTLFQGLTFLFLRSVACTNKSVIDQLQGPYTDWYEDECTWDAGSTANVVSVVCWFFTGLFMCATGLPKGPDRRPRQTQDATYELETLADGTQVPVKTKVVKGVAVPRTVDAAPDEAAPEEMPL